MHKRKLHVYKLRYVKDILNQARNLNRASLVKKKTTEKQNKTKTKKNHTNKQPTTTTNKNKRKRREQHIISRNNSSDNKDQYINRQLLLLFLTLLLLLDSYVIYICNRRLLESWEINIFKNPAQSVLNKLKICTFLYIHRVVHWKWIYETENSYIWTAEERMNKWMIMAVISLAVAKRKPEKKKKKKKYIYIYIYKILNLNRINLKSAQLWEEQ